MTECYSTFNRLKEKLAIFRTILVKGTLRNMSLRRNQESTKKKC